MNVWVPVILAVGLLAVVSSEGAASGADEFDLLPTSVVFDTSDWIVEGTVASTESIDEREELAILKVSRVWRGPADRKVVRIRQPKVANTAQRRFEPGARGYWIHHAIRAAEQGLGKGLPGALPSDDATIGWREVVWWRAELREEFERTWAARAAVPAGEPVNGLALRLETFFESPFVSGPAYEFLVSVKNVSDGPIVVGVGPALRPLSARWTRPNGEERAVDVHGPAATEASPPAGGASFVTLAPGGVAYLWPHGPPRGIVLVTPPKGEQKLRVEYCFPSAEQDPRNPEAWRGTLPSNEVEFKVP